MRITKDIPNYTLYIVRYHIIIENVRKTKRDLNFLNEDLRFSFAETKEFAILFISFIFVKTQNSDGICGNIVDHIQFSTHRASENVLSAVALYEEFTAKSLTMALSSLGWGGVALLSQNQFDKHDIKRCKFIVITITCYLFHPKNLEKDCRNSLITIYIFRQRKLLHLSSNSENVF